MTDAQLLAAQQAREDRLLDAAIDGRLEILFAKTEHPGVSQATTVGPHARHKLRGLLRYYAKSKQPFTDCVHDNMKRFGPNRTERVCATLKDIIRGTTHWRGHPALDHGSPGAIAASDQDADPCPITLTDQERTEILTSLSDEDWSALEEAIQS